MMTKESYGICAKVLQMSEEQLRKFMSKLSPDAANYLSVILNKLTDQELETLLASREGDLNEWQANQT